MIPAEGLGTAESEERKTGKEEKWEKETKRKQLIVRSRNKKFIG